MPNFRLTRLIYYGKKNHLIIHPNLLRIENAKESNLFISGFMTNSEQTTKQNEKAISHGRVVEFDEFSFDTNKKLLRRCAEIVPLAPKACELLNALIINAPEVLSKEELMNQVWNDSFVEEANLTHHVSALRKALGEDKNGRKFIETIPRKGYRFIAEVKSAASSEIAEVVFNERERIQVVEEMTLEANELSAGAKTMRAATDIAQGLTGKKRRSVWILATTAVVLVVGAAAFLSWRYFFAPNKSLVVSMPDVVFERLVNDSYSPSISPDGASVAFASVEKGQEILWRKQVASGQMTQLAPAAPTKDGKILSTRFSPDGRWIYYKKWIEAEGNRNIYRIPAGGGAAQKIVANVDADFSISPDGGRIAFARSEHQLVVAETETGTERVLVECDGITKAIVSDRYDSVVWSPDGSKIVYAGWTYKYFWFAPLFAEVEVATGAEKSIPFQPPPLQHRARVSQLEYLPDGSGIIGLMGNQVWLYSFQTEEIARVSGQGENYKSIRLSKDGKTLVAERSFSHFNIWTAAAGNLEKKRQITTGAAAQRGTRGVILAPNGKIIFTSPENSSGERNDLWEMDADGGNRRQLTVNAGLNVEPKLSRDGRYVVYKSNRSGAQQIWRMDADGRNPTQLSTGIENLVFSVSPDNEVYYLTVLPDKGQYQLFKIPATGGEPIEVTDRYYAWSPDFSPDGKLMLTWGAKTKEDDLQLAVIDRVTGNLVLDIKRSIEKSHWSADSQSIYYVNESSGQLFQMPIDGGEPKQVTDFYPLSIADYDLSPDEKQMVFSLGETTNEIVLIKNFSSQEK